MNSNWMKLVSRAAIGVFAALLMAPVLQAVAAPSADSSQNNGAATIAKRVVSDSWITAKVKSELLADNVSKGLKVDVDTSHGVVTLKGALPTEASIKHVTQLAMKVEGVKRVDSSDLVLAKP